jgi:hypothetical protein
MGTWVPANYPNMGMPGTGTGDGFGPTGGFGLEPGIREYVQMRGVPLEARSVYLPNFDHFQTEVRSCNNVILTLHDPSSGVPWNPESEPIPVNGDQSKTGFHCVTAAGVDCGDVYAQPGMPRNARVAISDPWADMAETGWPGRVRPAAHPAGHAPGLHNDPAFVSHDHYNVQTNAWPGSGSFYIEDYLGLDSNDAYAVWMTVVYPTADRPVSFSVAPQAEGLVQAQSAINDVYNMYSASRANQTTVFESSTVRPPFGNLAGDNRAAVVDNQIGLQPSDNIDSLSYGKDCGDVSYFSVCANSQGLANTGVRNEAVLANSGILMAINNPQNPGGGDPGSEAAGDIFKAGPPFAAQMTDRRFGREYYRMSVDEGMVDLCWSCLDGEMDPSGEPRIGHPRNKLLIDDIQMGLQAPQVRGSAGGGMVNPEDNIDAFEYAAVGDPVWGVEHDGDGVPDDPMFFTLNQSNSIGANPWDILVVGPHTGGVPMVYADGMMDIGLFGDPPNVFDDIDALALADITVEDPDNGVFIPKPDGLLDPGFDEALFSLAPGSATLAGNDGVFGTADDLSAADVFYTDFTGSFSLWTDSGSLGLRFQDNLNALDVVPCMPTLVIGDFDGNGVVNGLDIPDFKAALADPAGWAAATGRDPHMIGDFDCNGAFNGLDIPGFKAALAGAAIPEPATLALMAVAVGGLLRRRR